VFELVSGLPDGAAPTVPFAETAALKSYLPWRCLRLPEAAERKVLRRACPSARTEANRSTPPYRWELLPPVLDLADEAVLASLRETVYAQFLESDDEGAPRALRFRHALTREHIAALPAAPERVALAARLVAVLLARRPDLPAGPPDLAADLCEQDGDLPAAVGHLVEAARPARREGGVAATLGR
jgi:hypothetical protein